jgi:hypothetical protein
MGTILVATGLGVGVLLAGTIPPATAFALIVNQLLQMLP